MKTLRNIVAAILLAVASLAVGAFAAWSVLAGGVVGAVGSEHATDPSAQAPGEQAEPCTEPDGACLAYDDVPWENTQRASAVQLMAEHDCWTMRDGAPADVDLPGGAVISVDGGDPEYTTNALAVGAALDAALDGVENGVEAIAFCRGDE